MYKVYKGGISFRGLNTFCFNLFTALNKYFQNLFRAVKAYIKSNRADGLAHSHTIPQTLSVPMEAESDGYVEV